MNSTYSFRGSDYTELYKNFETIKIDKCISCKNSNLENWVRFNGFKADKCKECNLIFMNPQLNEEGIREFYKNYIGKTRLNNNIKMKQRSIQYKMDVELITKFIQKGIILDIGCSGGYFLKEIPGRFEKYGTEIDPFSINLARKNLKINQNNLYLGNVLNCPFDESYFDLITMRGVIEHVTNPEDVLKKISSLIKPRGLFYICATPNGESFAAKLYKQNWNLFHPIEHLWHFSPQNLSTLANKYGLKLIWSEYPYIGTPYEDIANDIKLINKKIDSESANIEDNTISPPFFENMMSLIFIKQ